MHEQLPGLSTWVPPIQAWGLWPEHPQRWWWQQSWWPAGGQPAQDWGHGPEKALTFRSPPVARLRVWAEGGVPHPDLGRTAQHPWTGWRYWSASITLPQLLQVRPTFPRWGLRDPGLGLGLLELNPHPIPNLEASGQPCLQASPPSFHTWGGSGLGGQAASTWCHLDSPADSVTCTPRSIYWAKLTGFMTFGKSSDFSNPQFLDCKMVML